MTQKQPYIIGLTGGIGSGKSEVTKFFAQLGIPIIDADVIARQVVTSGSKSLANIKQHFGQDIVTNDGKLNRQKLRQIIFQQPEQKLWLENLLHPIINCSIQEKISKITPSPKASYCIVVSPLLIEAKQTHFVNRVLVIQANQDIRINRVKQRDNTSLLDINAIINSQLTDTERNEYADDLIENNGNLTKLKTKLKQLHQFYLKLSTT